MFMLKVQLGGNEVLMGPYTGFIGGGGNPPCASKSCQCNRERGGTEVIEKKIRLKNEDPNKAKKASQGGGSRPVRGPRSMQR